MHWLTNIFMQVKVSGFFIMGENPSLHHLTNMGHLHASILFAVIFHYVMNILLCCQVAFQGYTETVFLRIIEAGCIIDYICQLKHRQISDWSNTMHDIICAAVLGERISCHDLTQQCGV